MDELTVKIQNGMIRSMLNDSISIVYVQCKFSIHTVHMTSDVINRCFCRASNRCNLFNYLLYTVNAMGGVRKERPLVINVHNDFFFFMAAL